MLAGADAVRRRARRPAPAAHAGARCAASGSLVAFALLAAFTALSITWSLDAGGVVARDQPHARLPGRARRRARARPARAGALGALMLRRRAVGASLICGWSLLTKVFPARAGAGRVVRAPARRRSSTGTASAWPRRSASRRCSGSPRAAPATPAVNALAWPALGLLIVCLLLAYSRGALLAAGHRPRGLARARAAAAARGRRCSAACWSATVPLVAWAFAQDGPDRRPARRWRCASTPGRRSGRCCCCSSSR